MTGDETLDAVMAVMDVGFDPHWREAWTRAQVRDSLDMPSTFLLAVDRDGQTLGAQGPAAGFVLSRQAVDEEELLLIAVRPENRGRGVGAKLIASHITEARRRGVRRIFLEMRANNPAHGLYKRCGYSPIGVRPSYYRAADGKPIDAITFAIDLER